MKGEPFIEALGPVVIDRPVTIRVQVLSERGGPFPFDPEDGEWEEMDVSVVLASAQCEFPDSDQGKGTIRGSLKLFRSGRCVAFEAVAVPTHATGEGLVSMLAMFDHKVRHSGAANRNFLVERDADD